MELGDLIGGRYRLDRRIGRGGMAQVFAATDTRLNRSVAVKVLATHLDDDARASKRFEREVLAVAGLQHPNIVAVHDADVEGDQPYLVTELLEGGTLADRIRNGPLTSQDTIALASQIAAGLAEAHAQGMIHRDVKPANVLLSSDGTAKVADFGIVQALNQTATMTSSLYGSTAYVAPEQIRGHEADARTDVYALGCVLHEMLTGRAPYVSDSAAGVIGQHLSADVPAVVDHRPRSLPPVPADLAALVTSCLAKLPENRPGSMIDLQSSLKHLGADGASMPAASPLAATALLPPPVQGGDGRPGTQTTALMDGQHEPPMVRGGDGKRKAIIASFLVLGLIWLVSTRGESGTPDGTPTAAAANPTEAASPAPTPSASGEPRSADQAIGDFRAHLEAGRAADQISKGDRDALKKGIDAVQERLGQGKGKAKSKGGDAVERTKDLKQRVQDLRDKEQIDQALADALQGDLDALLAALGA